MKKESIPRRRVEGLAKTTWETWTTFFIPTATREMNAFYFDIQTAPQEFKIARERSHTSYDCCTRFIGQHHAHVTAPAHAPLTFSLVIITDHDMKFSTLVTSNPSSLMGLYVMKLLLKCPRHRDTDENVEHVDHVGKHHSIQYHAVQGSKT